MSSPQPPSESRLPANATVNPLDATFIRQVSEHVRSYIRNDKLERGPQQFPMVIGILPFVLVRIESRDMTEITNAVDRVLANLDPL